MSKDRNNQRFEVLGNAEVASLEKSHSLRGAVEHLRTAGRDAKSEMLGFTCLADNLQRVINQRVVDANAGNGILHFEDVGTAEHRAKMLKLRRASLRAEDFSLGIAVGISHLRAY